MILCLITPSEATTMKIVPLPNAVLELAASQLPADVESCMREMGGRAVLAGGYLRSLATQAYPREPMRGFVESQPKDIDLFVADEDAMSELATRLSASRECIGYRNYGGFPAWRGAVTFRGLPGEPAEVQVIGEWTFESPVKVIENFDFMVSAAALWWGDAGWEGVTHEEWYRDVRHGRAHYNPSAPNPAGTLLRLSRYLGLGWKLDATELICIAARAAEAALEYDREYWDGPPFQTPSRRSLEDVLYYMCMDSIISPPRDAVRVWTDERTLVAAGG